MENGVNNQRGRVRPLSLLLLSNNALYILQDILAAFLFYFILFHPSAPVPHPAASCFILFSCVRCFIPERPCANVPRVLPFGRKWIKYLYTVFVCVCVFFSVLFLFVILISGYWTNRICVPRVWLIFCCFSDRRVFRCNRKCVGY